jgi:uncharacterized protein
VFFHIQELELRKKHFDRTYEPGEIEFEDPQLTQISPLHTKGVVELLSGTLGEVRVRGEFGVRVEVECDRCLEKAQYSLDSTFDLFYRPAEPGHQGEEEAIDEGEAEIAFYEGDGFDLKDVVREQVLLQLPMQRLCRPDCQGICPQCGANRNHVPCDCHPETTDDRWAALRNLKS